MKTTQDTVKTISANRISDNLVEPTQERETPSVSKDIYVLCDGAIKKPTTTDNSVFSLNSTALKQQKDPTSLQRVKSASKQLAKAESTPLNKITSKRAVIWLQKLDENKLAVQWNVPNNIKRNCQDLLLNGEQSSFVLRLYQNISVGKAEWKASHRTLEYPINILKRKCYVNLENGGGIFSAEIGVRSTDGRYIFIARSEKRSTARHIHEGQEKEFKYNKLKAKTTSQEIKTPKVFKSKGKLKTKDIINADIASRDIIAESQVSGLYTDFLREGPRVLRRKGENIKRSSLQAREEFLNALKSADTKEQLPKKRPTNISMQRLDSYKSLEEEYQNSPIKNAPEKSSGYIAEHLGSEEIKNTGVMVASMLNTAGTVAIDVFKRGENKNLQGKGRKVVKVQSKKDLAQAMKKSGIREKSELILSGKLTPGRRVRVGGLLIATEADGSFYVSCSIKDGKLHVPVEEIEAIVVE